jgi:HEAT repeat protein
MKLLVTLLCVAFVPATSFAQGVVAGGASPGGAYSTDSQIKGVISPEDAAKYGNLAVSALIPRLCDYDPRVRQASLLALQALGPMAKPAIPAIVNLIRDPDSFVRIDAVQTAVKLGEDSVPYLIVLLHDEIGEVRYLAARAIEEMDPPVTSALPAMMASLRDIDPRVRQVSIFALERMGLAARPAIMMIADLFHDPDSYVRIDAARALSELGPDAVPALALLLCDMNGAVRESAAQTIQKIAADMPTSSANSGQ